MRWLVIFCVLISFSALAAPEVATDEELTAAYCVGVIKWRLDAFSTISKDTTTSERDLIENQKFLEDTQNTYNHIRAFLESKDFAIGGSRDFTPIVIAKNRGINDERECLASYAKSVNDKCTNACWAKHDQKCTSLCPVFLACTRAQRCNDIDQKLPF